MRRAAFIYEDAFLKYRLSQSHPLQPSRLRCTYELLDSYGAFKEPGSSLVKPQEVEEEALLSIHTREYVEAVKSFSHGERLHEAAAYNFSDYGDNPVFPGMYEASLLAVSASLKAAELVSSGEVDVAFNISGGLHHAAPAYASGFCIFNDPAIVIAKLVKDGMRVAYVDIDAHHGDGVQNAFYTSNQVLTTSLHESGRYLFPGTGEVSEIGDGPGRGYAVNIPLAPYTTNDIYLWAFEQIVPPLLGAFQPDIMVTQLGIDTHYDDPLTHLSLTTQGYIGVIKRLRELVQKWVALGGGGYNLSVVPRAWTLAYGVMMDKGWPDEIPSEYQERYGLKRLRDQEMPQLDAAVLKQARRFAENTVERVQKLIFPLHGL